MAFLSTAINRVNKDIVSAEHRKENIEELDLMEAGRYYQPNGLPSEKIENVCYNVLPQFCCLTNLGQYKSLRSIAKGKKSSQKINLNKI